MYLPASASGSRDQHPRAWDGSEERPVITIVVPPPQRRRRCHDNDDDDDDGATGFCRRGSAVQGKEGETERMPFREQDKTSTAAEARGCVYLGESEGKSKLPSGSLYFLSFGDCSCIIKGSARLGRGRLNERGAEVGEDDFERLAALAFRVLVANL